MSERYEIRMDPRAHRATSEIAQYGVTVFPLSDRAPHHGDAGSGTCVSIGGRYFVATAAHVIEQRLGEHIAVLGSAWLNRELVLVGSGRRTSPLDVGWLEVHPREAKHLGCRWLPLSRIAPQRDGTDGTTAIFGASIANNKRDEDSFETTSFLHPVEPLHAVLRNTLGDPARRMYFRWPRFEVLPTRERADYPDPHGISGGGVWALNANRDDWLPHHAQLIGIEFATGKEGGETYVVAQRIHCWLEMLAEDVPEIGAAIRAYLLGASVLLSTIG